MDKFAVNVTRLENKISNHNELVSSINLENEELKLLLDFIVPMKSIFNIKLQTQILKQLEKNRHLLKQLNQKWTLEELTKEAFKPSRISYIFSIDPEYEF